jgi:methionine-gamma-lyase
MTDQRNNQPAPVPGFATRAIHHGYDPLSHHGALIPPVYLTATFAFPDSRTGSDRFAGNADGYFYSRISNPTVALLESRLAELEGGEAALATSSGMGAITTAVWTLTRPGDRIVADRTLYGCTFAFLRDRITAFGVEVVFADLTDSEELRRALTPQTRLVYAESPSNPDLRLIDIAAVSAAAHEVGALVAIDNTYCTPYLQQPLAHGADLVLHSLTKYLSGHGDVLAGAAVGSAALIDQLRMIGVKEVTGASISAFDAAMVLRGLKTLELRMDRHCASAQRIAELLVDHPAVATVHYPGLANSPYRDIAARQMSGPGGMIALELHGGRDAGVAFMDALTVFTRAVSLGDCESLVQHPATMTHAAYSVGDAPDQRISDGLVRLSVGLETVTDLCADLQQALDQLVPAFQ